MSNEATTTAVSGSFISDVEKLTNDILKYFPKFFDDFKNWEYGTGHDAGKDFKKIFNKAKKLNKSVSENYGFIVDINTLSVKMK